MNQNFEISKLFQGTGINQSFYGPIFSDITNLTKYFPTLKYFNYNNILLIQGTIPIKIGNFPFQLPINISLPSNFPSSIPNVQIPPTQQYTILVSNIIRNDGFVNSSLIFKWIERQSALPQFVTVLVDFFSKYPPIKLNQQIPMNNPNIQSQNTNLNPNINRMNQPGLQQTIQQLTQLSNQKLTESNNFLQNCYLIGINLQLNRDLELLLDQILQNEQNINLQLQNNLQSLQNQSIPDYIIDSELENFALNNSIENIQKFSDNILHELIRDQKLPLDKIIDLSKNYYMQYFSNNIFNKLKEAPQN